MWLSKQRREAEVPLTAEETVRTVQAQTVGTEQLLLYTVAPGGFAWRPKAGDQLVVLKDLAVGSKTPCPIRLAPGECCLFTQGAYIHLTAEGEIALHGQLTLNGQAMGGSGA